VRTFDVAVIGAGTAGLVSAAGIVRFGKKVALVERDRLGGECLYTGCVPSKALIRSAQVAHLARRGAEFGIQAQDVTVDFPAVMRRVKDVIASVGRHDSPERFRSWGVEVIKGEGAFESEHRLVVGGEPIEADRVVVCTGSRSFVPEVPGLREAGYITHVEVFDLKELPESLVIIGGGPIGSEMGQAFARLGSKVTLIERKDHVLNREDAELANLLMDVFRREGVDVRANSKATAVTVEDGKKGVTVTADSGEETVVWADEVLVATGRKPNTEALQLQQAGVAANDRGYIQVDSHLRTSQGNIWACGDVNGLYLFTHMADYQARVAVSNVLFPIGLRADYTAVPWTTFTDPELAHVGLTEAGAKEQLGDGVRAYVHKLADVDRAEAEGETDGLIKLVTDRKGRLVGAHILSANAGELLAELTTAVRLKRKVTAVAKTVHVYPTLALGLKQAADLYYQSVLGEGLSAKVLRWLAR